MGAVAEERCPLATLAGLTGGRTLVRSSGSGPDPSSYVSNSLHYSPQTSIYVVLPMYTEDSSFQWQGLPSDVWGISFPESGIMKSVNMMLLGGKYAWTQGIRGSQDSRFWSQTACHARALQRKRFVMLHRLPHLSTPYFVSVSVTWR